MKIVGNTVGTTLPKPNLEQDDPRKGDYVKGKEEFASKFTTALNTALAEAKESGEFNGADGAPGTDGKDGEDGVSVTHSWDGTTLTVTSASGTSSADLKGEKGDSGSLNIDDAFPGQGVIVKETDGFGKPVEWGVVDLPVSLCINLDVEGLEQYGDAHYRTECHYNGAYETIMQGGFVWLYWEHKFIMAFGAYITESGLVLEIPDLPTSSGGYDRSYILFPNGDYH